MHAKTTVAISSDFKSDRLWLNGVEESVDSNPRLVNCLREVRTRAKDNKVMFTITLKNIYNCYWDLDKNFH